MTGMPIPKMNTTVSSNTVMTQANRPQNLTMNAMRMNSAFRRIPWVLMACATLLGGCSITPKPVTIEEVKTRAEADKSHMYVGQEPITAPLTLEEVVARALKYNLDYHLKRMESALALGLSDVASMDMLPKLVTNAGYRQRNNFAGGTNVGILDGIESTNPTRGEDPSRHTRGVEFSWNVLDFGVSYYRARQQADHFLIAEERRRKVVQNLLQDVRAAYWRALGAQRLKKQADEILERAAVALSRSREAETQKLISPGVALAYQRALLDATTALNQRRQDLEFAKHELAALMNVPNGMPFTVAEATETVLPQPPRDIAKLEDLALVQRPELREEDLRKRVTADEARKQLLGMLPGIQLSIGAQYDNNRFLFNNQWSESSMSIAWNLIRLANWPAMRNAQKQQETTDQARRLALSMAIMTQLRVSNERYRLAVHDFRLAEQAADVDQRLANFTRASVSAKIDSELESVRAQSRAVLGAYQRANAYANAQIAFGKLYSTLGFDAIADNYDGQDLKTVTDRVRQHLAKTNEDAFSFSSNLFSAPPTLAVKLSGVDDPVQRVRSTALIKSILERQSINVLEQHPKHVEVHLSRQPAGGGMQRLVWDMVLIDTTKSQERVVSHESVVPSNARASVIDASLSNALQAHLAALQAWAETENTN